mgnify:CR=1 FL=1
MPATQHGYDLLKDTEICLGQHTNICAGRPICDPKLIPSIVQENGEFKTSKEYRSAKEDKILSKVDAEQIIRLAGCEKADFAKCQNAVLRGKSCTLIKEFYLAYPNKANMRAICQRVKVLSSIKPSKNQPEDRKAIWAFFQEKNKTKFLHDCEEYAEKRAEYMYARR